MESIYYVMAWACHRRCKHCYEERFRPYVRGALGTVVAEAVHNFPSIFDHFPERFSYIDLADSPDADGQYKHRPGRVVLSGGESLLDAVRESVTYSVIERLQRRFAHQGGVKVVLHTTGDLLTDRIVGELLERGTYMISVASVAMTSTSASKAQPSSAPSWTGCPSCSSATACASQAWRRPRATGMRSKGRCTASSALRPICGSASCGRAAAPGRTTCRVPHWPTTSATAGRAG
jgi:hypothetical protein